MSRVSAETRETLDRWLDEQPKELREKCKLCRETLTDLVKRAEVATGAGTATVCQVLAEKVSKDTPPADQVSAESLEKRVRRNEGKVKGDETSPLEKEKPKKKGKPVPADDYPMILKADKAHEPTKPQRAKCELCGMKVNFIELHLRESHPEITIEEYASRFPDAPLFADGCKEKLELHQMQWERFRRTPEAVLAPNTLTPLQAIKIALAALSAAVPTGWDQQAFIKITTPLVEFRDTHLIPAHTEEKTNAE
jgi:hypothetical protein